MNLIEKLGIEKCKQIVEGAPSGATDYSNEDGEIIYYQKTNNLIYWNSELGLWDEVYFSMPELKSIPDIRTAIADHDQYWYGQSEQKELEQYAVLSQEKIEGGAVLIGDNSKVVQMVRDIADNCSNIANHISPRTTVIDK